MSTSFTNRDFFELVKAIGESKSKQEEDRIIAEEVQFLKKKIPEVGVSKKKMKEYVIRAVYVELLGQDASFAYIKAVELCASSNIIQKRVGYLSSALFFSPDHEFRFMLVNQIQRDMNSSNHLETCAALTAVCKIVTADMVPAVIGEVVKLLKHEMEVVRKRAVCALHRLFQMDSSCIIDHVDKVRRILCDKDPSVMGASLILLHSMILADPIPYKDLVPSFVSILKQIIEHRLPREFDYHRIPAPWIQLHLLRILALLGRGDQQSSEGMYEILVDVMRRADTGINVGYAIVYESVRTITTIYPNPLLLDAAATAISRFIRSDSHNLKYIGIKGLATIVKDHPKYAADHQMAVIDCLEDPDETLKRKTLDLLFRMTNSVNVEFIVEKLLSFLATATDDHFRTDLVGRITQCAERFAPSNSWFVNTVVRVFELAGDKVKMSVAQTLMQLIAEGSEVEDDEDNETGERRSFDDELRTHAVEDFLALLQKPAIPDVLAQAMAWVLGEYGYLSHSQTPELIMVNLLDLCKQTTDPSTRCYTITAIMKLVAQCGVCPPVVQNLVRSMSNSKSLEVVQRSLEFQALLNSGIMADVLPVDASLEDIEVDPSLPFLDGYVQIALNHGAATYSPPSHLGDDEATSSSTYTGLSTTSGFKIGPYEKPTIPVATNNVIGLSAASTFGETPGTTLTPSPAAPVAAAAAPGNQLFAAKGVAQVWGRKPEVVEPPPASPATTAAPSAPQPQVVPAAPSVQIPSNPAPATQTAPEAPRAPTEKEKMAAALFGGVGGSSTSNRRSSGTAQNRRSSATAPATTQVQKSDILDLNNASGPPSAPAPAPPASTASATASSHVFDLLDMDQTLPATPQIPPSSPPIQQQQTPTVNLMAGSGSNGGGGLFDDLVPSPASHKAPQSSPTTLSVHDAFSDLMGGGGTSSSSPTLTPDNFAAPRIASYNPIRLTTAEFGTRWGHTPAEAKRAARLNTVRSLDQLTHALSSPPAAISHVESIPTTSEAIFATTLASSALVPQAPLGSLLLIHTKLIPQRGECFLTVKAPNRELGEELLNLLVSKL